MKHRIYIVFDKKNRGNFMNDLVGTWGIYRHFLGDEKFVHPDDFERFEICSRKTYLFHCVEIDGEYLVLDHKNEKFRVKPDLVIYTVPEPDYLYDQQVSLIGKEVIGIIEEISWHSSRKLHMYFISVDGKLKSKRYWKEELERLV